MPAPEPTQLIPELPATLWGAYLLAHFTKDEERVAYLEGRLAAPNFMARWDELSPEQRKHWEAVAIAAQRFITEKEVAHA